jgi:hypothetical protein
MGLTATNYPNTFITNTSGTLNTVYTLGYDPAISIPKETEVERLHRLVERVCAKARNEPYSKVGY